MQPSWQSRLINPWVGMIQRLAFRTQFRASTMRWWFQLLRGISRRRLQRRFPQLLVTQQLLGGVACEIMSFSTTPRFNLFYLHGGGYIMGSIPTYRMLAVRLARICQARVVLVGYRLAPEHPYPAALDDAMHAYAAMLEAYGELPSLIGGDSAGGGLALATLLARRDRHLPLPRAAFAFSPWADLTSTAPEHYDSALRDIWLTPRHITSWAPLYAANQDRQHPYISPVYGDYQGVPPLLLLAGGAELIQSDARRVAQQACTAGVETELQIYPGMQHVWPVILPWLPESRQALAAVAAFTLRCVLPDDALPSKE